MDSTGIKGGEIGGVEDIPLPEKSLEGEGMLDGRDFAGRQSQGVREVQEDSYGVVMASEFGGGVRDLFVLVADGMGGAAAGEHASQLAAETVGEFVYKTTSREPGMLTRAFEEANRRVLEAANLDSTLEGMGTT
ncbi:MAG: protein phosphatase 2C domain-containing protein, partial [Verrucomicrobiota bacterium]